MIHQKPQEQFEEIVIELKNKMVVLKVLPFDTDIMVDEILKIDYNCILEEILTFNVLFNRIANLQAEQENIVNVSKMDLEAFEAQLFFEKRKQLLREGEKATEAMIEASIKNDPDYKLKKKVHFETIKNLDYMKSLYWASQNKCSLLKVLSDKLRPEEFSTELLTESINGVMIKMSKKAIL